MSKVKKGSLVHLYRRKVSGVGLVLKQVEDMEKKYGIDVQKVIEHRSEVTNCHWGERTKLALTKLYSDLSEEDKSDINLMINCIDSYCSKWVDDPSHVHGKRRGVKENFHRNFCKVKWLNPPGEYSDQPVKYYESKIEWFPTDWLKEKK